MKIAYVTEWDPYEPSGVLRKIVGQVSAWKAAGANVRIFTLAPLRRMSCALDFDKHGKVIGRISRENLVRFRFARLGYFNKIWSAVALKNAIQEYDPDIIYYRRQGPWYPGLGKILRLAPTVTELNGNIEGAKLWGIFNAKLEMISNQILKRFVSAYVAVSPEIADEFRRVGKPIAIIPNSLPQKPSPLPPSNNNEPAFIFVGSTLAQGGGWHGVDKIFDLAAILPSSRFEIVGLTKAEFSEQEIPGNVRFHGPTYGKDLEAIYQNCDVGIGTLALHRRGMEKNSALKPLEYLTYGLPIILGYEETEAVLNSADYTLLIGNYEKNILNNVGEISAFAKEWQGKRVLADLSYLSSEVIEEQRLDFLATVISYS